jgi:hypothetical protein
MRRCPRSRSCRTLAAVVVVVEVVTVTVLVTDPPNIRS